MKKILAIILELVPVLAALVFFALVLLPIEFENSRMISMIAMPIALLGFAFFFLGRKIGRGESGVLLFGILDWLASISIVAFYVLAIFNFGQ